MAVVFDSEPLRREFSIITRSSTQVSGTTTHQRPHRSRAGSRTSTVSSIDSRCQASGVSSVRSQPELGSKSVSIEDAKCVSIETESAQLRRQKTMPRSVSNSSGPFATTLAQHLESDYEEIWVRSMEKRPKRQLIYVIPGNPGLVRAYVHFVNSLARHQDSDVCIVGHLGHCTFSRQVFDLPAQVLHHRRVLKKHSRDYPRVLVLGHSIGGHIALQLSDVLQSFGDKLIAVGLLAPVLSRFSSRSYWSLRLFSGASARPFLQGLIKYMPNRGGDWSEFRKAVLEGQFLPNILSLVRDCLSTLTEDLPRSRLSHWGLEKRKLFIIYAAKDRYTTVETQRSVRYCAEPLRSVNSTVTSLGTIRHNFVLFHDQTNIIVDLIDTWIRTRKFVEAEAQPSIGQPSIERLGLPAVGTALIQAMVQTTVYSGQRWSSLWDLLSRFSGAICLKRQRLVIVESSLQKCKMLELEAEELATTVPS